MDVEITPTKKIVVMGLDNRPSEELIWCASTFSINRLFWIDGLLICVEVYEKAFEREMAEHEFPISQVCYTEFPRYRKFYEVEKGVNLPIVNASGISIFKNLVKAIREFEQKGVPEKELQGLDPISQ